MPRIGWITDIHLNFLEPPQFTHWLKSLRAEGLDALLVGGDISEALSVVDWLIRLDEALRVPIYFVLGNHDFYHGGIELVRSRVRQLGRQHPRLCFLTESPPVALTPEIGLVGHDGWADGRVGDYQRSYVMMNDYRLIEELAGWTKLERWSLLKSLGDAAAAHISRVLPEALRRFSSVYLLTHVPPLREACWYEGAISDDEWAPHFTCQAMGDAILSVMRDHPTKRLTVLCGHTHSPGEATPLPNVRILTGAAKYGEPAIPQIFQLPPGVAEPQARRTPES